MPGDRLLPDLERLLAGPEPSDAVLQAALDQILAAFDCQAGTLHTLPPGAAVMELRAQRGVPEVLLDRVRRIPIGKGMAGLAAERREPVRVCNLQTDDSGAAKPAARATGMEGSISVPLLDGDTLRGALGIAKALEHDFSDDETRLLMEAGAAIARRLPG
jgi:GAF domain-containing protein